MGGGEDVLWAPLQVTVVEQKNQARNGPILPADVLLLSHYESSCQNVNDP